MRITFRFCENQQTKTRGHSPSQFFPKEFNGFVQVCGCGIALRGILVAVRVLKTDERAVILLGVGEGVRRAETQHFSEASFAV